MFASTEAWPDPETVWEAPLVVPPTSTGTGTGTGNAKAKAKAQSPVQAAGGGTANSATESKKKRVKPTKAGKRVEPTKAGKALGDSTADSMADSMAPWLEAPLPLHGSVADQAEAKEKKWQRALLKKHRQLERKKLALAQQADGATGTGTDTNKVAEEIDGKLQQVLATMM